MDSFDMRAHAASGAGLPAAGARGSTGEPGQKTCLGPLCLINRLSLRNDTLFGKLSSLPNPFGSFVNIHTDVTA